MTDTVIKLRSVKAAPVEQDKKGTWQESIDIPGARFKVSSLHHPDYQAELGMLEQKWAREYPGKPVPQTVRVPAVGRLLLEHILHDWSGFDEAYSPELAAEMMSSYEDRILISAVQNCAAMAGMGKFEFVKDEAKNSGRPSATTSSAKA